VGLHAGARVYWCMHLWSLFFLHQVPDLHVASGEPRDWHVRTNEHKHACLQSVYVAFNTAAGNIISAARARVRVNASIFVMHNNHVHEVPASLDIASDIIIIVARFVKTNMNVYV
jgi:hypothetical protein